MHRMGIEEPAPQPDASEACPGYKICAYLLRNPPTVRANQVWELDIAHILVVKGYVHPTAVFQIAVRRC
jgi:hypothetical protein